MPSPKNDLLFLPLGGCGEIGMNLNLFGYGHQTANGFSLKLV